MKKFFVLCRQLLDGFNTAFEKDFHRIPKVSYLIPWIMSGVLCTSFIAGSVHVYGSGEEAAASLELYGEDARPAGFDADYLKLMGKTEEEIQAELEKLYAEIYSLRTRMSRDLDDDNSYVEADTLLTGSILTADGVVLYGSLPDALLNNEVMDKDGNEVSRYPDLNPDAFKTLIGSYKDVKAEGEFTRYIWDRYKEDLSGSLSYNLWNGFSGGQNVELGIHASLQSNMYDYLVSENVDGTVCAYNYETGEVICLVSTPVTARNKCFLSFTPGSVNKTIILYLMESQGISTEGTFFECKGSYLTRADGESIHCNASSKTAHGLINGATAMAKSCNCYFAQAIEMLDLKEAAKTLEQLGFLVNPKEKSTTLIGKVPRNTSVYYLGETADFNTIEMLIGNDEGTSSPFDLMWFAAELYTCGNAATPKLLVKDETEFSSYAQANSETFTSALATWQKGFSMDYSGYDCSIGKTGTVLLGQGTANSRRQRTFIGCDASSKVAFFIEIDDSNKASADVEEISNRLVKELKREAALNSRK